MPVFLGSDHFPNDFDLARGELMRGTLIMNARKQGQVSDKNRGLIKTPQIISYAERSICLIVAAGKHQDATNLSPGPQDTRP